MNSDINPLVSRQWGAVEPTECRTAGCNRPRKAGIGYCGQCASAIRKQMRMHRDANKYQPRDNPQSGVWSFEEDDNRGGTVKKKNRKPKLAGYTFAERAANRMLHLACTPPRNPDGSPGLWLPEDEKSLRKYIDSQLHKIGPLLDGVGKCAWSSNQGRYITIGKVGLRAVLDDRQNPLVVDGKRVYERIGNPYGVRRSPCFMSDLTPEELDDQDEAQYRNC